MHDFAYERQFSKRRGRGGKRRFDDEDTFYKFRPQEDSLPDIDEFGGPPEGDRWSTWDQSTPTERGPIPHPDWLVTDLAAVDTELGILKTGKEADVFLIRRGLPGAGSGLPGTAPGAGPADPGTGLAAPGAGLAAQGARACLLAAKRYRDAEHRMFHRDSGYLEGRRTRESRVNRAMASRSSFGRQAIAGQWAYAEFMALTRLYLAGVPVPYPVQITGTEVLLEFIGSPDGTAAPRLAETRPEPDELSQLWDQLVSALTVLAQAGMAHGDLSAYNLLVHDGRLVMIDLPQVVDVIANPRGGWFLERDAANVGRWFTAHGLRDADVPPDKLPDLLRTEAMLLPDS